MSQKKLLAIKFLLLGIIGMMLVGCGPRYVIETQYITPQDSKQSNQCITTCQTQQNTCQTNCQRSYQQCLDRATYNTKQIEAQEYNIYNQNVEMYNRALADFEQRNRFKEREMYEDSRTLQDYNYACQKYRDRNACERKRDLERNLKHMEREREYPPTPPSMRTYQSILAEEQAKCPTTCGCQQNYNSCFTGCGGKVVFNKICVANCD